MSLKMEDYGMVEMTVEEARALLDEDLPDPLVEELDAAQGVVFSGEADENYLIIKIVKGNANG